MTEFILTKKRKILELSIVLLLIFIGVSLRLLPHPPNFAPIAALALFGGVYLNKKYALIIPLLAMLASDYLIGFYNFKLMASVYGSFLLIGLIGLWLRKHKNFGTVIGSSLAASTLFFIITNFAVWAFTVWYPKTLSGLIWCYTLAIPFFKNTILGDLLYVSVFFGAYELISVLLKSPKYVSERAPSISI
ncbi:MAG: hypothetical protein QME61_03240 [Patescibacteria group bacterium]|nr:hypothetical protein [Patescibacteria group bacterium]